MRLFKPLTVAIAWRYSFSGQQHKFATFVALLSTLGITIGVCALIVVSSIMQGLQSRLKGSILSDAPQLVVLTDDSNLDRLLELEHVTAAAPFIEGEALLQTDSGIDLITLRGMDKDAVKVKDETVLSLLKLHLIPARGSFNLVGDAGIFLKYRSLGIGNRVRLISTKNARYTPLGLTPTQRMFTLVDYLPSLKSAQTFSAIGNFDDVRRLFRATAKDYSVRLWLDDAFNVETVAHKIRAMGYDCYDWRATQGEFFKAVAMEKVTMTLMLFLIVVVAAFNILSALAMMVSARLQEIAVLKTVGISSGAILRVFMMMGLSCGIIGSLLGTLVGIPLALNSGTILNLFGMSLGVGTQFPVEIDLFNIIFIVAGCLLLSLLCTIYPALKAASTNPVEHLCRG
ncbi:MAG: FtsX-like permease family protein [Succinivibrio sp.]|nr:FtsX-like permease family protein [Succinivibrio sp.]